MNRNFVKKVRDFFDDDRGIITVEFVLWAPILILWILGTVVFFDAFKERGHLISTNATIADIVSRNSEMTVGYMNLLQVLQTSLLPNTNGGGLRISSIIYTIDPTIINDPGTYSVLWSSVTGATVIPLIDDLIDPTILPDMYSGETILLVESSVRYTPMTRFVGISPKSWRNSIAISPRYESRVVWIAG